METWDLAHSDLGICVWLLTPQRLCVHKHCPFTCAAKLNCKSSLQLTLRILPTRFKSPPGLISSDWRLDGDNLELNVTIAPNTTGTVFIPAKTCGEIREVGKGLAEAEGVKFLRMENQRAVLAVDSGSYSFQSKSSPDQTEGGQHK